MELSVIGINHKMAPVAVRERVALPDNAAGSLLCRVRDENVLSEALVVDTCNRTEVYFVPVDRRDHLEYLLARVREVKKASVTDDASLFYRHNGLGAVAHLFRVAAALDSQIVGEHQILGQLKKAYRLAVESRSTGFLLNKLFHWAFRVGKKVQTDTELGMGAASVSLAAVELAKHVFSTLSGKTIMLLGAGNTAELAARALVRCGAGRLIVANRTMERGRELAGKLLKSGSDKLSALEGDGEDPGEDEAGCALPTRCRGDASAVALQSDPPVVDVIGLDGVATEAGSVDLIICSTGAEEFVLGYNHVGDRLRRSSRSVFIIDIAVPRDVDPRLAELPNVFLYNIDDLNELVGQNIERRRREIPRAQAIVDYEVAQFGEWLESLQSAPTIRLLREQLDELRRAEIRRYGSKFASTDREQLEKFAECLCKKILHKPLTFLGKLRRDQSATEALETIDIIRRMFDLDGVDSNR